MGSPVAARSAVWTWIGAALLTAGCAATTAPSPPVVVAPLPDHGFVEIALGDTHLCGRTVDGQVACWGSHHAGQLGLEALAMRTGFNDLATRQETPRIVPLPGRALELVAAAHHSCARLATPDGDRRAVCWGEGGAALVDLGLTDVRAVATGRDHVCALRDTGAVACQGWAPDRGDAPEAPVPLEPMGGLETEATPDVLVAASGLTCAGHRGDGWLTCAALGAAPVSLPQVEPFAHVDTSSSAVCTLDTAGTLRCWSLLDLDPTHHSPRVQPPTVDQLAPDATGLVVRRDRCALYPSSVVACAERSPVSTIHADPDAIPADVLQTPGLLDLEPRLGWGCAITAAGQARCWADDERAWRLGAQRATLTDYQPGPECPPDRAPYLAPELWACLDARGRRQGAARLYWPDSGRLQAEGDYRDDVRVGDWVELTADGRLRSKGAFDADGRRDGLWTYTRLDPLTGLEQLAAKGAWSHGVQVGTWRWPHEGRSMTLSDTGEPLAWTWAFATGTQWQLRRDDADQWWREQLDADGALLAAVSITEPVDAAVWAPSVGPSWVGGYAFDGDYEGRHEEGRVEVTGTFAADQPHGRWSAVDVDGQPRIEGTFDAGRPVGPWRLWHASGQLALSGEFVVAGIPDGRWQRWHDDGQLAVDGRYDQGTMVGTWTWRDRTGEVVQRLEFEPLAEETSGGGVMGGLTRYDAVTGAQITPMLDPSTTTSARTPTLVEEVEARVDLEPWLDAPGTLSR